jgi:nitrite reductase/ring-hydroxylating ferredoxin subunit
MVSVRCGKGLLQEVCWHIILVRCRHCVSFLLDHTASGRASQKRVAFARCATRAALPYEHFTRIKRKNWTSAKFLAGNRKFVAFDAICTHAGCPVDYDPSSQHLLYPCHGAEFDPSNGGAIVQGPTNTPLTSVPIHIDNATGEITLQ